MGPLLTAADFAGLLDAQVGKPYILGAEASINNSDPKAFDCSELVEWAYGLNGTPIGDLAASQYDKTLPVFGSPKVGDLVFLKNNARRWNRVGHVAILTKKLSNGDWRIIEARGSNYGVVRSTLSYWKTRAWYTGVRRFPGFALKTTTPVVKKDAKIRCGSYNIHAAVWGGNKNYKGDALVIRDEMKSSVFFLQEAIEEARDEIRRILGSSRYLTWPTGMVCVMWDSSKYNFGKHDAISFGTVAARAMKVELEVKLNGEKFIACSVHIRPSAVTDEAGKLADVRQLIKWLAPHSDVVVGGDWNTEGARELMEKAGYILATPWRDTLDGKKDLVLDAIYVRGKIAVRNLFGEDGPGQIFDPEDNSDHKAVGSNLTVLSGTNPN